MVDVLEKEVMAFGINNFRGNFQIYTKKYHHSGFKKNDDTSLSYREKAERQIETYHGI